MSVILAVTGSPILHSRSPDMFNSACEALVIDASYIRLSAESAKAALDTAQDMQISGMNVTAPFKEKFCELLSSYQESTRLTGSVNTILQLGAGGVGANTDIDGVKWCLTEAGINAAGKLALVVGAGGAARAAIYALKSLGANTFVTNRTAERADVLAKTFDINSIPAKISDLTQFLSEADIVIRTTQLELPTPKAMRVGGVIVNAIYGARNDDFTRAAKAHGIRVISGHEWLLGQGCAAFKHFFGSDIDPDRMSPGLAVQKPPLNRIALIGLMGVGKSSVGRELAALLNVDFIDTDSLIEKRCGSSIADIFRSNGEQKFRELEEEIMAEVFDKGAAVIACGGGSVLSQKTRNMLKSHATSVWLWGNPKILAIRLADEAANRPLLAGSNIEQELDTLLSHRRQLYARASDLVVDTTNDEPKKIARRIYDEICSTR